MQTPLSYKLKRVAMNWRVWLLVFCLIAAIVSIHPVDNAGVAIRSVAKNSSAEGSGFVSPKQTDRPTQREAITSINGKPILSVAEYHAFVKNIRVNDTVLIRTNQVSRPYRVIVQEELETIALDDWEDVDITTEIFNSTLNETINISTTERRQKTKTISHGPKDIGLTVYEAPSSNLREGLDLQGGTRVLLKPQEKISQLDLETTISSMSERLNVYGLSDVILRSARDFNGEYYVVVEIAGANEKEVRELLSQQGKFEAKVGNTTVFAGGNDVTYVCRTADCSGIDPSTGCSNTGAGYVCRFRFSIALNPEAAQRQADATQKLEVISEGKQSYLSQPLDLFLDDEKVDSLNIGSELRGRAVTDISISGSGQGATHELATFDSLANMKRLQTILITGSLPVKLDIVKTDSISPSLGEEFLKNSYFIGFLGLFAVLLVVLAGYRRFIIVVPMMVVVVLEIILLLGVAALIGWNIDVAAIAGIIVSVGTGVNDQVVIADEVLRGGKKESRSWKQRVKDAFFIIMGAYFAIVVAMLPLLFAGAGLLKGFAITTIIGVSIGVFITRPAYSTVVEILLKDEDSE